MTKKDYELIASVIHEYLNVVEDDGTEAQRGERSAVKAVARNLSYAFERDNPKFNEFTFIRDCGL